jgi:hypothetical protein
MVFLMTLAKNIKGIQKSRQSLKCCAGATGAFFDFFGIQFFDISGFV